MRNHIVPARAMKELCVVMSFAQTIYWGLYADKNYGGFLTAVFIFNPLQFTLRMLYANNQL